MAINEANVLRALKKDLVSSEPYHDEWQTKREIWIKEWNGEPYGNEVKGKATVVSRDIKKTGAWQHASIIEPFVSSPNMVKCDPVTYEDRAASNQNELLLNYQFCRNFNRYQFASTSFKVLQREGTVIARTGWEFKEIEVDVEVPIMKTVPVSMQEIMRNPQLMQQTQTTGTLPMQEVQVGTRTEKQMQTVVNKPTVDVCNNAMIYVDPTCENNIENAQFVIYKYKSNITKLKKEGLYKNLDKINLKGGGDPDYDEVIYDSKDTDFKFSDKAREEVEVVEYWGNFDIKNKGTAIPMVCAWIDNTVIRLDENPYPGGEVPFVSCAIDAEPFSINGNANAELIGTEQKIKTGIKRAIIDTLDASTNAQKGIKNGILDPMNKRKFMQGEDFEFNGSPNDIWMGKFNEVPQGVLNFYQMISMDIEGMTGVKSFSQGLGSSSLGESATAARGMLDATAKREVDISRNYKDNFLVPILRKWAAMNAVFLEDEEVIRITNEEFVPIRRDDLDGNIDIQISVSTAETDANKASDISFMLQTMAQSLPFDLTKILLSEQAELKKMPDLAKKIMEYQPQPDPLEEKRKELEVQKLESEIMERKSRAMENQVDMELKRAKTQSELAKARGTHSNADKVDQEFLKEEDGTRRNEELEDKVIEDEINIRNKKVEGPKRNL